MATAAEPTDCSQGPRPEKGRPKASRSEERRPGTEMVREDTSCAEAPDPQTKATGAKISGGWEPGRRLQSPTPSCQAHLCSSWWRPTQHPRTPTADALHIQPCDSGC
ncbi:uncharacterized protein LOC144580719 [Callithrix jacchus]